MPVGLPVPEIKLPKRQPKDAKDKPQETRTTVASVNGSLRKLGEKDLLLQPASKDVLRFRLLAKTRFSNKDGDPIRDSLLRPGDQLTVEVSPDDEETALRVLLMRSGTDAERKASERPVEESAIRAPRPEDLSKPRSVSSPSAAPAESAPGSAESPAGAAAPDSVNPAGPSTPLPASDEQVIAEASEASATFTAGLPDYLVEQVTTRYFSPIGRDWQTIDVVSANLAYVNGKEDYRDIKINGWPSNGPPERSGTWSTGEFGTTLEDLMSPATSAAFKRRGDARLAGRDAVVFDYSVEQARSHWTMVSPDGRRYNPAYRGAIWIDKQTRRVLRIEQRAADFPRDFPLSRAECVLDYGFTRIENASYLLPAGSENIGCMSGSNSCTRNVIQFRNYRKYTADSTIKYFAGRD